MSLYNRGGQGFARPFAHQSAASDPDTLLNLFVKNSSSTVNAPKCDTAGAGEAAIGIVNDITITKMASVIITGQAFLRVNGNAVNIAPGDPLKVGTGGRGVKAATVGDRYFAVAMQAATTDGAIIEVIVEHGVVADGVGYATNATASAEVTAAQLAGVSLFTQVMSANGATALAIPGAASVRAGQGLLVKKTGTAGAITITPAAGTINGGATYTALNAQNDMALFIADGAGDWVLGPNNIA